MLSKAKDILKKNTMLIALGVLMLFLWGGQYLLAAMHLRQESVSIAGGIVLFLIGLRMIFPSPHGLMGDLPDGEHFIVPMAIPMIAGPSGMAAVMLLGSQEPDRMGDWMLALVLAYWVLVRFIERRRVSELDWRKLPHLLLGLGQRHSIARNDNDLFRFI